MQSMLLEDSDGREEVRGREDYSRRVCEMQAQCKWVVHHIFVSGGQKKERDELSNHT